jgi:hypothetical protein
MGRCAVTARRYAWERALAENDVRCGAVNSVGGRLPMGEINDAAVHESAIAALYHGPLEEFVARRDTLARQMRAAGDGEQAAAVKALRKPSRLAWALNLGVHGDDGAMTALDAAVAETLDAQAQGGDVRSAMTRLRGSVRDLAGAAAAAAERAGYRVEASVLANAVLAVLGRPDSFAELRGSRLTDIPEAGGLDFLASLPAVHREAPASSEPAAATRPTRAEAAARENARRAADELRFVRRRVDAAEQALREAESRVAAAAERVRSAESELASAQSAQRDARSEAAAAAEALESAEAASVRAQDQLKQLEN